MKIITSSDDKTNINSPPVFFFVIDRVHRHLVSYFLLSSSSQLLVHEPLAMDRMVHKNVFPRAYGQAWAIGINIIYFSCILDIMHAVNTPPRGYRDGYFWSKS